MRRAVALAMLLGILLTAGCAASEEAEQPNPTPRITPSPTPEPTPKPTPVVMEQRENPVRAFIEDYSAAVAPHTALLDAPVELTPDSFQGLMGLAQQPVRLQKMLHAVSSLEYDGEGRWSVGMALSAEQAAGAGVEELRGGYAFTGYTADGFIVSGTLKDDFLRCTWRNGEGFLAGAEAERRGDDWRCVVYLDETADGVWIEGDTLLYTTELYYEDCFYEDEPLMMAEPADWEEPYLRVTGDTAVMIDPEEIQGEQEQ